jgi:DNA-binding MarR family transcriptional regulator
MDTQSRDEMIPEIISEFSQMFAAAKSRWTRLAEEIHPDLRGPGMMILQTILRHGPVTATGIGGMLDMDKAMVSRQVTQLRNLGLVDAKEADSDRRVILLTVSTAAHDSIELLHSRSAAEYRARFEGWEDDELAQLQRLLHRFNSVTEDLRGTGPARRCAQEEHDSAEAKPSAAADPSA